MKITVSTTLNASLKVVWHAWTAPEHITGWNFASSDWCCPRAESDFQIGGNFSYRMESTDGSMGFDLDGTFIEIIPMSFIRFALGDGREVAVEFTAEHDKVRITETFDAEDMHTAQEQQQGWQCILDEFKRYTETLNKPKIT